MKAMHGEPVKRFVNSVQQTIPSNNPYGDFDVNYNEYFDPGATDAILHSIEPSLIMLKELSSNSIANEYPARRTFVSTERHKKLDAHMLADLWGIGLKRAKMTLEATTQMGTRSAILPLSRGYRADKIYGLKILRGKFATDSLFPEKKSLNGHGCSQIYSHKCGFAACYPIDSPDGDSIGYTLRDFCHDFGKPEHLTFDGHMAQRGQHTFFMQTICKYHIDYHISSPRRPNEQPAEGCIRVVKIRWYRIMMKRNVP